MAENILILNMTRIGDLIQTSPLIRGIRESNRDAKITMLANKKFAGIARFIEGIDELLEIDVHQFGSDNGCGELDTLALYDYLDDFAGLLENRNFDTVINLSHTNFSAVLAKLTGAPDIRGFSSTPRGERRIRDPWLVYFTTLLSFRKLNRFNLVDLYMRGAGVKPGENARLNLKPDTESLNKARSRMGELGINENDLLIGIQAGASREDRRWSPRNFAAAADRLVTERGAKIVLFGAPSEKKLGDQVEEAMTKPAINLIGQTGLGELAGWVERVDLLITNDTGTMHIAAAAGTPIAALFFVHARAEETGPYTKGAVILQADIDCAPCSHQTVCGHMSCLEYITPDDVVAACAMALDETEAVDRAGIFEKVKVYRSDFHEDGSVDFVPATKKRLDKFELFAYLYRPVFNASLPAWNAPETIEETQDIASVAALELKERFSPPSAHALESWASRAAEGAQTLIGLCRQGQELAAGLEKTGDQATGPGLEQAAGKLAAIDRDIEALAGTHEALAPLVYVYRRRAENFEGDGTTQLARAAGQAYQWLGKTTGLFQSSVRQAEDILSENNFSKPSGKTQETRNHEVP